MLGSEYSFNVYVLTSLEWCKHLSLNRLSSIFVSIGLDIKAYWEKISFKYKESYSASSLVFVYAGKISLWQVECPKFPGFCITRQKKEYPFIEIFHSPEQVSLTSHDQINVVRFNYIHWQLENINEYAKFIFHSVSNIPFFCLSDIYIHVLLVELLWITWW